MLKSIDFIDRLEKDLNGMLNAGSVINFYIELRINQVIDIYIVLDKVCSLDELNFISVDPEEFENNKVRLTILDKVTSEENEYKFLFENENVSLGLRRSLSALLGSKSSHEEIDVNADVITFFSYKGGVGRTTSLALTATYLARNGLKVFVVDCDFEAPGLINFFDSSQSSSHKSGLVEYLNDREFDKKTKISEYVYNIDKSYSGEGTINLMSAGNILGSSDDLNSYVEGLAKIDLQGFNLINTLRKLVSEINSTYNPDVILIDSRTGFNNVFGALARLSKHVVVLAGDDIQNQPGLDYISSFLLKESIPCTFVLSILSRNFSRRFSNFNNVVQSAISSDAFNVETFYFERLDTLEFIGTPYEDKYDLDDFIEGKNGSSQYHLFFDYLQSILTSAANNVDEKVLLDSDDVFSHEIVKNPPPVSTNPVDVEPISEVIKEDINSSKLQDIILDELESKLPDLYAENIVYDEKYLKTDFYIRPCMEDFFIEEKVLLLGDKGTGKTAFYSALQHDDFFNMLIKKSQKEHLNYKVFNVTNFEYDNFEVLGFKDFIKDELFFKKFWLFFIWNSIFQRSFDALQSENPELLIDLTKSNAESKIISLINDQNNFDLIEAELLKVSDSYKSKDERLIVTFDRLDNIVKPYLWDNVVSPLVKLAMRFPYSNIFPKLFLRRDLFDRLGNLTNKNSFKPRTIGLEWSQNEIFSYFLKIVFNYSYDQFFNYLRQFTFDELRLNVDSVHKKLKSKGRQHNQLPLDTYLIMPIINVFFGEPKPKKNGKKSTAYQDLYRNIQSADKTVNLRPFIDLISYAIKAQKEQESEKGFRKGAILGLAYCTSKEVRKNAVIQYLEDLWNEQGNEFVKYFCQDFANNRISLEFKKSWLDEVSFEKLLSEVKQKHMDNEIIANGTIEEYKQILVANKIIFPYMVGSKSRYAVAFLYTNYLGL